MLLPQNSYRPWAMRPQKKSTRRVGWVSRFLSVCSYWRRAARVNSAMLQQRRDEQWTGLVDEPVLQVASKGTDNGRIERRG